MSLQNSSNKRNFYQKLGKLDLIRESNHFSLLAYKYNRYSILEKLIINQNTMILKTKITQKIRVTNKKLRSLDHNHTHG